MKHFILLTFSLIALHAISLQESIDYALEHNNGLKQTDLNVQSAKKQRDAKHAQNFGRVDVSASYDHYNLSRTLSPLTPMSIIGSPDGSYKIPTTQDLFSAGISYNVVLFNGFAQQSSYKISDLMYQNSTIRNKLGREELIYNVRNLYVSILALEEQLQAQTLYTESEKRVLSKIEKQRALGSKSKLDYLRAKNAYESSKAQESTISANIEILKASLTALFGDKEFDNSEAIDIDMLQEVDESATDIKELQRYKAAQIGVQTSERKIEQAKSAYYPVIDFGAYYGQSFGPNDTTNVVPATSTAPTAGETLIDEGDWNNQDIWQLGLHLKWNILDFGSTTAKYEESKISYLESQLESNSVAIDLRKNISTAKSKIKLAQAQYSSMQSQYELLDETEKIEQVRYDNNALTLTDLLETQAKKSLARAQMINAKYDYQKAIYYLDYLFEKGERK